MGVKDGHYFWVSPDKTHVIDLTGDQFAYPPEDASRMGLKLDEDDEGWTPTEDQLKWRPGPVLFKRADHPAYKGFRVKDFKTENPRVKRFAERANAALEGRYEKQAIDLMGDGHPMDEPQAIEDMNNRYLHDEPDYEPGSAQYKFVYVKGKLHVSPDQELDTILDYARVPGDYNGPSAAGYVSIVNGKATWSITGNIGGNAFSRILRDYTKEVGWKWGGMLNGMGNPIHDSFAERKARILKDNETGEQRSFYVQGKTAYVPSDMSSDARNIISEMGYKVAEYPGGTNMNDRIQVHAPMGEDLELYDNGDATTPVNLGEGSPDRNGVWRCKQCGRLFGAFNNYMNHLRAEEPMGDELPREDGQFPEVAGDYDDQPQQHYREWEPQNTIATVLKVASYREAARVDGFDLYSKLYGYDNDKADHYVAYEHGEPIGYATVRPTGEVVMVQTTKKGKGVGQALVERLQVHYDELWSHAASPQGERLARKLGFTNTQGMMYRWSRGTEPKDMIDAPVPFIYDVQKDDIMVGHPGSRHSDIPGEFTPGGIVEGTYEPGGNVIIRSMTNIPYTVRHMLDLWYWTHPQMEITKVDLQDADGNVTKLAAQNVGQYIRTLALTDPAVWNAYTALHKAGGEVFVVGGAVRDALLQKEPKDIDLMVRGIPSDQVNSILEKLPGKVDLTGKDFGVFRYRNKGHEVEIALPRTERSTGDRRVDFEVSVDHNLPVSDDLLRRDFTANSMAVNLSSGELIDPYGGADDIKNRRLDTTHEKSFEEDPTRLVRALVAQSRHGLVPTEKVRREIEQNAHRLDNESRERIHAELDKLFKSNNPAGAIRIAQETGLLKHIFPEVANNFDFDQNNPHHKLKLGDHLLNVLENVQKETTDPDLRLAGLLHDIGKPASAWVNPDTGSNHYYRGPNGEGADHETVGSTLAESRLRELKYPVARINRIRDLIQGHMFPAFASPKGARKFLNKYGDHADDLLTLRYADQRGKGQSPEEVAARTSVDSQRGLIEQVRSAQEPTSQSALNINGNDIISMGVKPGPEIGRILRHLTNDVVDNPALNDREALMQRAQEYVNALS